LLNYRSICYGKIQTFQAVRTVKKVVVSLQILAGLLLGLAGLVHIADSPLPGCGVALAGGFLIMEGLNRFW
jgi:hypothetical protein